MKIMSINNDTIIIIDSDSDDGLDELRELAMISMIKQEVSVIEHCNSAPLEYQILSSRKRKSSEISNEESKRPKLDNSKPYNVESIRESLSNLFNVDEIVDFRKNLLKEEELKLKLLQVLDNKVKLEENKLVTNKTIIDESDDNDDFQIFTHALLPKEIITDANVLKYHNLIAKVKNNIEELNKSIKTMSSSIQSDLNKSKKITMQIENLKNQKIQIHKDISVNRRRILDFNKVRKQKSLELVKYEKLKRHFALNRRAPPVSAAVDKSETVTDSLSTISGDTVDSRTASLYEVDCNHIICPFWLQTSCHNASCVYQHPKFVAKPIVRRPVRIKENDKVFLKEMNPTGFISKLACDACSDTIFVPTLHLTDDWHCKSCCQQLIALRSAGDIVNQLVAIWHHIYKRFVMSKSVSAENRDPSILQRLYKCTEAIAAKLHSSGNISATQLQIAGHHIILAFDEESRIDDLVAFVKSWNYHPALVLFASRLSFPVGELLRLVVDSIDYHIGTGRIWENPDLLIGKFCFLSKLLDSPIVGTLVGWLELCIGLERNDNNRIDSLIGILLKAIFSQILGPPFVPGLSLSLHELRLGDIYWSDRKETLTKLMQLYTTTIRGRSSSSATDGGRLDLFVDYRSNLDDNDPMHVLVVKYFAICQFFTGNEESALELCERYSSRHFVFEILLSKLSLEYNSPLVVDDKLRLIEHIYNKSQWLLTNRSVGSCVKLLETVPHILYRNIGPIKNPIDSLHFYRCFLEIGLQFDGKSANHIANVSDSEMKALRETSSIWLCYIYLLISIDNNINYENNIVELMKSDRLLSLPTDHLNRVAYSILTLFANRSVGDQYLHQIRSVFLFVEKSIGFVDFYELFVCVNFDNLLEVQLQGWLFLIDFCVVRFDDDCVDNFLVAVSRKLSENRDYSNSCDVFHHIVKCYPIRVEEVWLNFIELLLSSNSPLYELIDVCEMATANFRSSRLLWKHYGFCAAKTGDRDLLKTVWTNASKFGLDLS